MNCRTFSQNPRPREKSHHITTARRQSWSLQVTGLCGAFFWRQLQKQKAMVGDSGFCRSVWTRCAWLRPFNFEPTSIRTVCVSLTHFLRKLDKNFFYVFFFFCVHSFLPQGKVRMNSVLLRCFSNFILSRLLSHYRSRTWTGGKKKEKQKKEKERKTEKKGKK